MPFWISSDSYLSQRSRRVFDGNQQCHRVEKLTGLISHSADHESSLDSDRLKACEICREFRPIPGELSRKVGDDVEAAPAQLDT